MNYEKLEKYLIEGNDKLIEKEIKSFLKQVATGRYDEKSAYEELIRLVSGLQKTTIKKTVKVPPVKKHKPSSNYSSEFRGGCSSRSGYGC